MGFSNEGCCCCGVITGFLLAGAVAGAIWYFRCCRDNPEIPARDLKKVVRTWEKVKTGGDSLLEKAKQGAEEKIAAPPGVQPAPPPGTAGESFPVPVNDTVRRQ